jgi:outer membrane protein assembly factor BamB
MTTSQSSELPLQPALRLWPGIVAVVLLWLIRLVVPLVAPNLGLEAVLASVGVGLAILIWWLFFSRAPWSERIGFVVLMVVAILATYRVVDISIATGMMGGLLIMYGLSALPTGLVAGAVVGSRLSSTGRRAAIAFGILLACSVFALLRTDGIAGIGSQFAWRWTPTAEEKLLASERVTEPPAANSPTAAPTPAPSPTVPPPSGPVLRKDDESSTVVARKPAEWPGFRGSDRDGIVHGVTIETDWARMPPTQIWRRAVGPGWSSFAVDGDVFFTQEQRGEDEIVAAYSVKTGEPVWRHRDRVRFWESNGGAGPRGTPALDGGRVYAFGATGILNALDEATGAVIWSRNVATDSHTAVPMWGFTSSPLVMDEEVIVAAGGKLAAYDVATGKPRWFGPDGGGGYSSPQRVTLGGLEQILLISGQGTTSVASSDGAVLWKHAWAEGGAIVQPAVTSDGDVLTTTLAATGGYGIRRLAVARGSSGWTVEEKWTSTGLKPYYNDYVVHNGYAFGFDGSILSCIDLKDGTRKWKGGRYGAGQLVLLRDQDLLLVLSEEGDVVLVSATPDQFKEIAKVPAIQGKTWNHPVVVGDVLLVRNGEEMAAFRLPRAGGR